jgi:hypothetical protein
MVMCLVGDRGAARCGGCQVGGEAAFDRVAAEALAGDRREQRVAGSAGAFPKPGLQQRFGRRGQRGAAFLAAFADRVHVGAGGERDVLAGESGEFGDPQPGLDRQREHGVVAPAGPGGLVARGEQRVDLGLGEVGEQILLGPLGRDREHALDRRGVLGVVQGEVAV